MMETDMKWSRETYRLDEVTRKFDLPCVIGLNEGNYSDNEIEGFSQGDVMSIDKRLVLHKVAANFVTLKDIDKKNLDKYDDDYVKLSAENEILVPLNYKGKLKVLKEIKNFDSVKELANEFPRFAKMRANLTLKTKDEKNITISTGTVIELDRVLPGNSGDVCDALVVKYTCLGKTIVVALPVNIEGQFRTEPDVTEYTIKEAIDRYHLPQQVRFVDDEIKQVYTQDLLDGIENMKPINETLQLNRLVTQEVLVGHYKPIEGTASTDTDRFKQRTLVVLPTDNPEIRDIEVNVLLNFTEDLYSDIFMVRNVNDTEGLVESTLYVDFVKSAGIKCIQAKEGTSNNISSNTTVSPEVTPTVEEDQEVPPLPPKRGFDPQPPALQPKPKIQNKTSREHTNQENNITTHEQVHSDDDDYITMRAPTIPLVTKQKLDELKRTSNCNRKSDGYLTMPIQSSTISESSVTKEKRSSIIKQLTFKIKKIAKVSPSGVKGSSMTNDVSPKASEAQVSVKASGVKGSSMTNGVSPKASEAQVSVKTSKVKPNNAIDTEGEAHYSEIDEKYMCKVSPSIRHKDFIELTVLELVERLNNADMIHMANVCKKEKLNGAFFKNLTKEEIRETFLLNQVELVKFMQMRDSSWIPPSVIWL